jgi:hypothetical protein
MDEGNYIPWGPKQRNTPAIIFGQAHPVASSITVVPIWRIAVEDL